MIVVGCRPRHQCALAALWRRAFALPILMQFAGLCVVRCALCVVRCALCVVRCALCVDANRIHLWFLRLWFVRFIIPHLSTISHFRHSRPHKRGRE